MNTTREASTMARAGIAIGIFGLCGMAALYVRALSFTPVDAFQGPAQKIFYLHAPAAVVGLAAFFITGIASIFFLWLKDQRLDLFAAASAEVGLAFCLIVLTTGPIWAKPIWGTWWSWDARLTMTLFIFLLFIGYVILRGAVTEPTLRGQYSAVIGILGMLLVPFIHVTVYLFRTLHPDPVVIRPGRPQLPDTMLVTFLCAFAVYAALYVGFVTIRYVIALRDFRKEEALATGE